MAGAFFEAVPTTDGSDFAAILRLADGRQLVILAVTDGSDEAAIEFLWRGRVDDRPAQAKISLHAPATIDDARTVLRTLVAKPEEIIKSITAWDQLLGLTP